MTSLLYLYGLTSEEVLPPQNAPCVDGSRKLAKQIVGPLGVWFSHVDRTVFGEGLERLMDNLDLLASASVRHQETVAAIARQGSVIPARFATVFTSMSSLRHHVLEGSQSALETLRRVSDADEWGVKIFRVQQSPTATVKRSSGTEYLKHKAALRKREQFRPAEEFERFLEDLASASAGFTQTGKVSGAQKHLEWQASFLVKRDKKAVWDALLQRYANHWQQQHVIECTGPWPPYSFV